MIESGEIWKNYRGTVYDVSTLGRVRRWSAKNGRPLDQPVIIEPGLNCSGYKVVRSFFVHRMVLESFVSEPLQGQITLHLNGNKLDNRVENLRWGTYMENKHDGKLRGEWRIFTGESHGRALLTEVQVIEIRKSSLSQHALAREYGVSRSTIKSIVQKRTWKHIC